MESNVNAQTIRRTALRGKAFDQFSRGLITNAELQQQLASITLGRYDVEVQR